VWDESNRYFNRGPVLLFIFFADLLIAPTRQKRGTGFPVRFILYFGSHTSASLQCGLQKENKKRQKRCGYKYGVKALPAPERGGKASK